MWIGDELCELNEKRIPWENILLSNKEISSVATCSLLEYKLYVCRILSMTQG